MVMECGRISLNAAVQLLADARALGESLHNGAPRARWAALQRRRAARLERDAPCDAASAPAQRRFCSAARRVDAAAPTQPPSNHQGVLVVAGGAHGLSNAYILIRALRHIGCRLPVEVVYYGDHEYHAPIAQLISVLDGAEAVAAPDGGARGDDAAAAGARGQCSAAEAAAGCKAEDAAAAPRPRVRLVDGLAFHEQHLRPLAPHREMPGGIRGFGAKVHALCFVTSFEQVLMLDADNLAVQDPTRLFSDPGFLAHGNLFWQDFWTDMWVNLSIYRLLAMEVPWEADPTELAAEAGQVLLDRVRHYDTLEYLWLLATHPEVRLLWMEADAGGIAFHLAGKGQQYQALRPRPRQLLGSPPAPPDAAEGPGQVVRPLHHLGMAQLAPDGRSVMFYHRTAAGKLFPHCIYRWGHALSACVPLWITLPVDQQQLLESVSDPTEMVFQPSAVDATWHKTHCKGASAPRPDATPGAADAPFRLPECQPGWQGRRPVPLVPVAAVPVLEALLRWVHEGAFLPLLAHHGRTGGVA
ncbi:hypothetical protein MNEG_1958 [Monoraphidium neglectum]|uniref:Uncharacterized protein n=1 Tax=Monoraphidium neglectum TaxID=145388 RepID=A0A0D2N0B9_9CHLO|nr:hypothetical protein MNEG_1958 [Monoraphidium neglectum]KIZ06002.1 hypothetical protein MNEG_1958 [Monoraphidium neglectum]|eukprot:XP_013905021.1 hypothetical protein MNEG_1958 [Monoraphidium neglectum]